MSKQIVIVIDNGSFTIKFDEDNHIVFYTDSHRQYKITAINDRYEIEEVRLDKK